MAHKPLFWNVSRQGRRKGFPALVWSGLNRPGFATHEQCSIAASCQQHVYPARRVSWPCERARSRRCISARSTNALLVTGIFLEASPLCLDHTFQPAPIVHRDNTTPPSLPSCELLTSPARAGWRDGLDLLPGLRWTTGWVGQSPGWLRAVSRNQPRMLPASQRLGTETPPAFRK